MKIQITTRVGEANWSRLKMKCLRLGITMEEGVDRMLTQFLKTPVKVGQEDKTDGTDNESTGQV